MTRPRPPLSESAKAVQAARPAQGYGPSTRVVVAGLRERRPPLPVLLAGALLALPVLVLLAATGWAVYRMVTAEGSVPQRIFIAPFVVGILFLLAALQWRGLKRVVHRGHYDDGFFLARLGSMGAVLYTLAVVAMIFTSDEQTPWTAVLPYVFLVLLWLPKLPLLAPSAQRWPAQVAHR